MQVLPFLEVKQYVIYKAGTCSKRFVFVTSAIVRVV